MKNQTINGKLINEFQHLQVIELDTKQYLVVGGKFPLLFENNPSVDDLQMLIVKPKNMLNDFENWQLRNKGNVLVKKPQFFNDNSNMFSNWIKRETELAEFETIGY